MWLVFDQIRRSHCSRQWDQRRKGLLQKEQHDGKVFSMVTLKVVSTG